jgi:dihydroneopterin aldolase/2-amino-4-hydroxy-6-hydroxymethyldihydropteridine diphosphokinase/dihydropteroate synthase
MITAVSDLLLMKCHVRKLTLYIEKPSALLLAKSAGIQVTREQVSKRVANKPGEEGQHIAYIALGTNIGNRVTNILGAVRELRACSTILDTSFLYETPAAYVTDQPHFLNAVCKVSTKLSAEALLVEVKKIEQTLGRVESYRNGPRSADLDILFYDDLEMKTDTLEIPHPRIQEREFVLRPLCE